MTKRKNMTAAQRQITVEQKVEQLELATRMSQMLLQQIGQSSNQMGKDLSELATRQRDVQYRTLALQELLGIKLTDLDARAEELQVKDFTDASDKEDIEKGYTEASIVAEDSVVIITSKVDEGEGILRSKLVLSDIAFPKLREDLLDKTVGDVVSADINGIVHNITLLGIRTAPAVEEAEVETSVETVETPTPATETANEQTATEANG